MSLTHPPFYPRKQENTMNMTEGQWSSCCDSYGKVRHSKKACVSTTVLSPSGIESTVKVAAQISNWDDANVLAAAKDLLYALALMNEAEEPGYCICPVKDGAAAHGSHATVCRAARYAVAKARNRIYGTGELLPNAFTS